MWRIKTPYRDKCTSRLILVTLLLCQHLAESARHPAKRLKATVDHKQDGVTNTMWGDSSAEFAFNLVAFSDRRRALVRVYSEIEPKYVTPIATGDLALPHVNQCHFIAKNGTSWSASTVQVDTQWAYGDDDRIRAVNKVIAYTIDCQDPGPVAETVAPQLSTGVVLGKHVSIEKIVTERKGRLAACSQPLFTQVLGIRDWVDYHARMGVEAFHMHVPVGAHIDALFDETSREQRIRETTSLNERSPESVGMSRFTPFSHPKVTWQEYYGAPTANYYSETPLFNACVYRYRYAYDYVMLYDCDEWFTLRRANSARQAARNIPEFLDRRLPAHVASLQLDSYAFPAQCATSEHGDYVSRFTLRKKTIWDNMQKLIVRPLAVACTAIHGIFDITEQFKSNHLNASNTTIAEKYLRLPTDVAYIKHIRWFGPPNGTAISCKFGAEVNQWDPEYALVVQDDSPRRPTKEPPSVEMLQTGELNSAPAR